MRRATCRVAAAGVLAAPCYDLGSSMTKMATWNRALAALAMLVATACGAPPGSGGPAAVVAPSDDFARAMLAEHARYRRAVGVPDLAWSPELAAGAAPWARSLAARDTLQHAQGTGVGENLWMGTAGAYAWSQMVDGWGAEGRHFRAGVFPDVSDTGSWKDVGHYTQMVWRETRAVGCALATNGRSDVLVCRYGPAGNVVGARPF